jgi:CheY-like chemotaxis protein
MTKGEVLRYAIAFALRRSRKIIRGLKQGLTEEERYAVADHAVAQLKERGVTDVQMPGLSGLDLQDHLIARGHRIPIIFMTGYSDEAIQSGPLYRVYRESFEGYLTLNRVGKTV